MYYLYNNDNNIYKIIF